MVENVWGLAVKVVSLPHSFQWFSTPVSVAASDFPGTRVPVPFGTGNGTGTRKFQCAEKRSTGVVNEKYRVHVQVWPNYCNNRSVQQVKCGC